MPIHEFILVSKLFIEPLDYKKIKRDKMGKLIIGIPGIVDSHEIHDSLIRYLSDFILWIPSINIATSEDITGLSYYGETVFLNANARMLCSLFNRLVNLFLLAPEKVTLTGSYSWVDDMNTGEYEKLPYDKNELIDLFKKIASWNELLEKDNNLYIMHFGI